MLCTILQCYCKHLIQLICFDFRKRFPFYQANDDRWKNSVRHNLSINPHFRKGVKSKRGSGHLWTLSNECALPPDSWVCVFELLCQPKHYKFYY